MEQHHTQTHFGLKKKQKISNLLVELIHIYPKFVPYHSHSRIVVARKLDIGPLKAVVLTFNECHLHL